MIASQRFPDPSEAILTFLAHCEELVKFCPTLLVEIDEVTYVTICDAGETA